MSFVVVVVVVVVVVDVVDVVVAVVVVVDLFFGAVICCYTIFGKYHYEIF